MKIYFLFYAYEVGVSANIGGFRKLWELADRLKKQGHQVRLFFPRLPKYYPLKPIPYNAYPLFNLFMGEIYVLTIPIFSVLKHQGKYWMCGLKAEQRAPL